MNEKKDRSRSLLPWQARLLGKLVLSRVPFSYRVWKRIGLFAHGEMEKPAYAYAVFKRHYDRAAFPGKAGGFSALELGPGDSLFSALIAHAFGAASIRLVDTGCFARQDPAAYRLMARYLAEQKIGEHPGEEDLRDLDGVLAACNAQYGTNGLDSLRAIPAASIDFIWSQAVLEHIRKDEFPATMRELRRILRPGGACSHRVDLTDHLGGALNNLRFPEKLWESDVMARSGFYTNRIRCSEMFAQFEQAGFHSRVVQIDSWESLPTARAKMSREFQMTPEDELRISGFDVVLE